MSQKNANYVGGDIDSGANDPLQLVFRPRVTLKPYSTGVDGIDLCSAATARRRRARHVRLLGCEGGPAVDHQTLTTNRRRIGRERRGP